MRKESSHHKNPDQSDSGLRTLQAEALVFSSLGILWGFCQQNTAGRSVRARFVGIKTLTYQHMSYEAYSGKIKAIGKYSACVDEVKCGVLHREKHEVGYATGSHAIMRRCQPKKKTSSRSQVFLQAVATRMAAKYAVVRAGQYYEAGIYSSHHTIVGPDLTLIIYKMLLSYPAYVQNHR